MTIPNWTAALTALDSIPAMPGIPAAEFRADRLGSLLRADPKVRDMILAEVERVMDGNKNGKE